MGAIVAGAGAPAAGSVRDATIRPAGAHIAARRTRPSGAVVFPATGSWYAITRGHLTIGRGRLTLWHSPGAGWSARRIGVVVVGRGTLAFQYAHRLYMGPFDGRVRAIAHREMPLGWDGRRLYTNSYPRRALLLRGATGRLLKTLSPLPFRSDPVATRGSVYLVLQGELLRAHGAHMLKLTSLAAVGVSIDSWLQRVGGLLAFQDDRHLTILRPDGSVFARTPLPSSHGDAGALSSSPVEDPAGNTLAFTAAYGESTDPNVPTRARGTEIVYLLRAGAHTGVPVHTQHVRFNVCERGASLSWRGTRLRYANSEGDTALIDTRPGGPAAPRARQSGGSGGV